MAKVLFTFSYDTETDELTCVGNTSLAEAAKILVTRVLTLLTDEKGQEKHEKGLDK